MFENVSFCQPLVAAFHSPGERELGALSRLPRNRPNCLTIRDGLGADPVNCGMICGLDFEAGLRASPRKQMVGAIGFEPMTSTV